MNHSEFESVDKFLRAIGVGRRNLNDPFFNDTYEKCKVFRRTGVTVEDEEEFCHQVMREFSCSVPRCNVVFRNLIDYEIHYNGSHRYACLQCKTTRPNARLLEIHIQETHDSFFQVLAETKPMYQCYVSECDEKFSSSNERQAHCIAIHKFPKNFRYDSRGHKQKAVSKDFMEVEPPKEVPTRGRKNKVRLDKNQKSKTFVPQRLSANDSRMECSDDIISLAEQSAEIKVIETSNKVPVPISKSTLAFIPRQIAQKSYTKALTKNQKIERNVLGNNCMMELAESLPD